MKWLRALGSLTILVGVLVGVPWLLLTLGSPLALLDVHWGSALLRPDDGRILLGLLSVVGWVAWILLAGTVLAEFVAVLTSRRIDIPVPGTGWLRPVVGSLVAAALFTPGAVAVAAPVTGATSVPAVAPSAPAETPVPAPTTGRHHVVQPGDELWSIAEARLGSGERWRDLLTVNDGLAATSQLEPGQRLQLPPDVVVTKGDTLWSLAERHLGDATRWPEIHHLNADLVTDPHQIDTGWKLLLPATDPVPVADEEPPPSGATITEAPIDAPPAASRSGAHSGATVGPPRPLTDTPTPPPPAPAPSTRASESPEVQAASLVPTAEDDEAARVLGPIGGLLASTIIVGVAARRRLQLVARAVGRRLVPLPPETGRFWTALAHVADHQQPLEEPRSTTVVLGWLDDDTPVTHHLEDARCTSVSPQLDAQSVVAAMVTSLACAPWSEEVEVVVVGADQPWAAALDDPRVTSIPDPDEGVSHLTTLSARRRLALGKASLAEVRADPDTAPAYAPTVHLFARPLTARQRAKVDEALSFGDVGTSVVLTGGGGGSHIDFDGHLARLDGVGFRPQLVEAPARRALIDLFTVTGQPATEPAPWFARAGAPDARHALVAAPSEGTEAPHVVLLGEPDLLDARGEPPTRARQQCVEYAAWMSLHPGARSSTMQHALVIAEGTRRSNLSRLRKWLGTDADGVEYLPDAYDGRLHLDPRVTTDWHMLRQLLSGGVDVAPDHALRQALSMVQGPPLGSALHRWAWARTLHDDMVALLVDAACVLADRCLEQGRVEEALWALDRAEFAAPDHDEVAIRRVAAHRAMGDVPGTEQAVSRFLSRVTQDNREVAPSHAAQLGARSRPTASAAGAAPRGRG